MRRIKRDNRTAISVRHPFSPIKKRSDEYIYGLGKFLRAREQSVPEADTKILLLRFACGSSFDLFTANAELLLGVCFCYFYYYFLRREKDDEVNVSDFRVDSPFIPGVLRML